MAVVVRKMGSESEDQQVTTEAPWSQAPNLNCCPLVSAIVCFAALIGFNAEK